MSRRAFVVVLDACGAGELPDAAAYGDAGANTLGHLASAVGGLRLAALERLGLGSVLKLEGVTPAPAPALHGRLAATGAGKDSSSGHRELMGLVAATPPPTYPQGFPAEVIARIRAATGHELVCNAPFNGVEAIERHGAESLHTGALIVYTSQDSVLQIAGHVERVAPAALYEACVAARSVMTGEHAVGRVIARPFAGTPGAWHRTEGRRDFGLAPDGRSYLDELGDAGVEVHGIGKAPELFTGAGFDAAYAGPTNATAIAAVDRLIAELDAGLVFANLIETDQVFGHRKDIEGFHRALREIDAAVARWIDRLGDGDMLVLTADHGCDPTTPGTDHTREYAPLLARFDADGGRRHDGILADVGASVLWWLTGRQADLPGRSFGG